MKSTLTLAPNLSVPAAIAARTIFIAGTKGSGKTYSAGVIAEEMLSAGTHIVILDPLGAWFGLRSDAKGGPGGYPVVILGGEHADAPLLPTSGEIVADYIVKSGQSVILDMSGFSSNAEQDRFVTGLLTKLFRLKAAEKSALHLIIDEADMFAPERPMSGTEIPLLGATKTIVTKGRSRGLSMTMITQRPQVIAKAVIEEADIVFCHRMQGVNVVKAMKTWTDLYATKEQAAAFYESLPRLANGECWVWSPSFLEIFERHQFRRKNTFDSSRTPDPGEITRKPKAAATVDLAKLTDEMKATAEAVKANDPAELRRQVAGLKSELTKLQGAKPAAVKTETKTVEKLIVSDKQLAAIDKLADKLDLVLPKAMTVLTALNERQAAAKQIGDDISTAVEALQDSIRIAKGTPIAPQQNKPLTAAVRVAPPAAVRPVVQRVSSGPTGSLPEGEQKVLTVAAQYPGGATREQISILTGYKRSTRDAYLLRCRNRGLLSESGDRIVATEDGMAALGDSFEPLPTGDALREYWMKRLPDGERKLFGILVEHYPDRVPRDQLDEQTGFKRSTRDAYLLRLRTRRLVIDAGAGEVQASGELFV